MDLLQQFQNALPPFKWTFALLSLPLLLTMAIDALAWMLLFPGHRRPSYVALLKAHIGTEAIFLSMPGGFAAADVAKVVMLKKQDGIDGAETAASLVARRWVLGLSQIVFVLLCCALDFGIMENGLSRLFTGTQFGWIAAVLVLVTIIVLAAVTRLLILGRLAITLFGLFRGMPVPPLRRWLERHEEAFRSADECFRALGSQGKSKLLSIVGLYLLTWGVEALETYCIAQYLGLDVTVTQTLMIEAILSIVKEAVFFLPSGIVVKDVGYVTLFAAFSILLSPLQMLAFVVVKRFVMIVWVIIGYAVLVVQGLRPFVRRRPAERFIIVEQEQ